MPCLTLSACDAGMPSLALQAYVGTPCLTLPAYDAGMHAFTRIAGLCSYALPHTAGLYRKCDHMHIFLGLFSWLNKIL